MDKETWLRLKKKFSDTLHTCYRYSQNQFCIFTINTKKNKTKQTTLAA